MTAAPVSDPEARALFAPLEDAPHMLAAVSGGPDSMALLALLVAWQPAKARPAVTVACVDHGLRPEAKAEAELVAQAAAAAGFPFVRLDLPAGTIRKGRQDDARAARYAALADQAAAIGASHVVTAHHLDDQAETILMRLAAGSGTRGLAGMAASRPLATGIVLARPLLGIPRARLEATCAARGVPFATDPSNHDPRYRRTRWRMLMPALAAEGLTPARLTGLARRLARIEAALDADAARLLAQARLPAPTDVVRLDPDVLAQADAERLRRVLLAALAEVPGRARATTEPPLARTDALAEALAQALTTESPLRRTLGGATIVLKPGTALEFRTEKPRRRGLSQPCDERMSAAASLSLGKGEPRP